MPNSVGPLPHPAPLPVKVVLVPATPAGLQAGVLQANKRKLLPAVKRGDAAKVSELLRDGTSRDRSLRDIDRHGPVLQQNTSYGSAKPSMPELLSL